MTSHQFQVWLEWDQEDHVWVTYVPTLGHLSTFGETREEALANTQEAILGYLEAAAKEVIPVDTGGAKAKIVRLETELNRQVYGLYEQTVDEVRVIEEQTKYR